MALIYEKGLPHQDNAVQAILSVFNQANIVKNEKSKNPMIQVAQFKANIAHLQQIQQIEEKPTFSHIIDIAMETGTGKTYTYTKTLFDLHRTLGIFKFVIIVPTLSIKAGTKQFLQSASLTQHFRCDFNGDYQNAQIKLYMAESKNNKGKAQPSTAISEFVQSTDSKNISVLLINQGMLNSKTLAGTNQNNDGSYIPLENIASVNPFVIIDEPHKFNQDNKTWENIKKLNAQYILRYGATFNGRFENLVYQLTAIDAFNQDLVKGIRTFIEQIDGDNKGDVILKALDGKEATFLFDNKTIRLGKEESFTKIHNMMKDLWISNMNTRILELSNGLELKVGDKINPYSYADTVRNQMMRQAIKNHFDLEEQLLTRPAKIKPLTLFFIDDIVGYRENYSHGLKALFELMLKDELAKRLNHAPDDFLRHYWQSALDNIASTHGGYFSKDNSDKDEKIEQEVNEILYDKETLLSLNNPRRFIFSKWTLREGWDNPNVFQICKLRSSGSETSKLQEVGRGLRLPVNEYGARVKDGGFYLNYFVDSSEKDFVAKLVGEINQSVKEKVYFDELNHELIQKIQSAYPQESKKSIREKLGHLIDDNEFFIEDGFNQCRHIFPLAFVQTQLKVGKVENRGAKSQKVKLRAGKYDELKALWELINQKVLLQYDIENEEAFSRLFYAFLVENQDKFQTSGVRMVQHELRLQDGRLTTIEQSSLYDNFEPICTLSYPEFLSQLSQSAFIQLETLHYVFKRAYQKRHFDIRQFLNERTVVMIKNGFRRWLLLNAFTDVKISYHVLQQNIHPTKLTDKNGKALDEIHASDLGICFDNHQPLKAFLFESIFFDSQIEKDNMLHQIQEVVVFTKIPKNSIKIPIAGGGSYSPDFAYMIKTEQGEILNLILESKGVPDDTHLRQEEAKKIEHAQKLFDQISGQTKVIFKTQFEHQKVVDFIRSLLTP